VGAKRVREKQNRVEKERQHHQMSTVERDIFFPLLRQRKKQERSRKAKEAACGKPEPGAKKAKHSKRDGNKKESG
jgi:hypothetical protein